MSGESAEPADFYKLKKENEQLKAQLEALNKQGFEFVQKQLEMFFKDKGFGDSKALEKLMSSNEETMKLLQKLMTQGISASSSNPSLGGRHGQSQTMAGFDPRFGPAQP